MVSMLESMIKIFGDTILPYGKFFIPLGGSIFSLLIITEILREAINITTGKGVNLGPRLIAILFIGTILLNYNGISAGIYNGAVEMGKDIIPEFKEVNDWIEEGYRKGVENQEASQELDNGSHGLLTGMFISLAIAVLSGLGMLLIYIILILTIVLIGGAYASLALALTIGPVFIAMMVSDMFRQSGVKWILILVSYFLTVPLYVVVIKITASLYSGNIFIGETGTSISPVPSMTNTVEKICFLLINPLISLGLVFSVSKIVRSVTGSAGNVIGTAGKAVLSGAVAVMAAFKGGAKLSGKGRGAGGKKGNSGGQGRNHGGMKVPGSSRSNTGGIQMNSNPPRITGKNKNSKGVNGSSIPKANKWESKGRMAKSGGDK